ncbi:MAG: DUF1631 family protein [Lysobacteraceae bacterium]
MVEGAQPPLITRLRSLVQRELGPAGVRILDALDAALFERARSARGARDEQRCLDALRELRLRRVSVETRFAAVLGAGLVATRKGAAEQPESLSLYPRDELEERLVLSSQANAVATRLRAQLHPLNQRLARLLPGRKIDNDSNPLGPMALTDAFHDAFQPLEIDSDLRKQAFRLVGRILFDRLEAVYAQCNEMLAAAGVLPELPLDVVTSPAAPPPAEKPPVPPSAARVATPAAPRAETLQVEVRAASPRAVTPRPPAPRGDLVELHRRFAQRCASAALPPAASLRGVDNGPLPRRMVQDAAATLLRQAGEVEIGGRLKPRLLGLASQRVGAAAQFSAEDEGAVDLVDALFERMRRDSGVPGPLGEELDALRLPFLLAMLRDGELLSDPRHPARRLLDEFGDQARGWSSNADPGLRLLRQMQALRMVFQAHAQGADAGFAEALAEFSAFASMQRTQAEQTEQRTIEATRSRETLHQAQSDARLALEERMRGYQPSAWLHHLLMRHWSAYLVLLILRHGLVSEQYRQALGFAEALLRGERDAVNPILAGSFRARRLELETQLRQGLATLAYSDEDIVRLCGELQSFILARPEQRRAMGRLETESTPSLQDQPRPDAVDPAMVRRLRGLRPGTWFELGAEAERGKLSWISPLSGRWLLVNWAGRKVADLPPEQIAMDIANGLARVIDDAHLLRRAVDAVMRELHREAPADDEQDGLAG